MQTCYLGTLFSNSDTYSLWTYIFWYPSEDTQRSISTYTGLAVVGGGVGTGVGGGVGLRDGENVGDNVGDNEGDTVGDIVGDIVLK